MGPEQLPPEGLLATIVLVTVSVPPLFTMPPPPGERSSKEPKPSALLPEKVLLVTVSVLPASLKMPPPKPRPCQPALALLPEKVLVTVSVPSLSMPPPVSPTALPEKVLLVTHSVPSL
jgi:hypothetical protein